MRTVDRKIEFYKTRDFGEKFNDTFEFVKQNFKPLMRFALYVLLPISIITAFGLKGYLYYTSSIMSGISPEYLGDPFIYSALSMTAGSMLGLVVASSMAYGLMREYEAGGREHLAGLSFAAFRPTLLRFMGRTVVAVLVMYIAAMVAMAVVAVLGAVLSPTLIITIPFYVFCIVPLVLTHPVYVFEGGNVFSALAKAMRLGFKTWGGLFGIIFVVGFISGSLAGILTVPLYVLSFVKELLFSASEGNDFVLSAVYDMVTYLAGVLASFASLLSYVLLSVALGYQYAHTVDKYEGVSVNKDIDRFDDLADTGKDDDDLFVRKEEDDTLI